MACSRFEYVKAFEQHERLLPGCWAVVRLDGRGFTRFASGHGFRKPNDARALGVANAAGRAVLAAFDDHLACGFGQSDEFSFVLRRQSELFARRRDKILSTVVSLFTAAYVRAWGRLMGAPLRADPSFDGRVVLYPTTRHLRDYLAWRQADVHVNNLFNTAFWALVQKGGKSTQEAEKLLKGTSAKDKNELLFSQFGINYNNEPQMFRKGSFIMKNPQLLQETPGSFKRKLEASMATDAPAASENGAARECDGAGQELFVTLHEDIIRDTFWNEHPHLLAPSDLDPPRIRKNR